jgi:hypothetical protein
MSGEINSDNRRVGLIHIHTCIHCGQLRYRQAAPRGGNGPPGLLHWGCKDYSYISRTWSLIPLAHGHPGPSGAQATSFSLV